MQQNTTNKSAQRRGAVTSVDLNRAYERKMEKRAKPATMTVAALVKDEGVPVHVRLWLEQFIAKGKAALSHSFVERDYDTLDQARLIRDVLNAGYEETGDGSKPDHKQFSEEARDYMEEYLYRLANASETTIWNYAGAAVGALPVMLECAENSIDGNANLLALKTAIHRLTTVAERRDFLTGDRYKAETIKERERAAGFKLARLLANPKTPFETRRALGDALLNVTNEANIIVDHPALVRRALALALEVTNKRARTAEAKEDRRRQRLFRDQLFTLLDGLDG